MHSLKEAILTAWEKLKPQLDNDPDELHARLARRASLRLNQPVREWCIGLRANDRHLNPLHIPMTPSRGPERHLPHQIHFNARNLRALAHPWTIDFPDELPIVAKDLGVTPQKVRDLVRRGLLHQHRHKGLGGKHDRWGGIPLVSNSKLHFNPNAGHLLAPPDPIWATFWYDLPLHLPKDFQQPLTRIPTFHPSKRAAPLNADLNSNPTNNHNPPTTNHPHPQSPALHHPISPPPHQPSANDLYPEPYTLYPPPPPRFWGWLWLCPACNQTCRLILLPIPFPLPPMFEEYLAPHTAHEPGPQPPTFACTRCHNPRHNICWANPRNTRSSWNDIITRISGGLLFGHEVAMPDSLKQRPRKLPPRQHRRPAPAPRRHEIERRLLLGQTTKQIAAALQCSVITVHWHIQQSCKHHHVKKRRHLLPLLRAATTTTTAATLPHPTAPASPQPPTQSRGL